jgi:hypothetical protein
MLHAASAACIQAIFRPMPNPSSPTGDVSPGCSPAPPRERTSTRDDGRNGFAVEAWVRVEGVASAEGEDGKTTKYGTFPLVLEPPLVAISFWP